MSMKNSLSPKQSELYNFIEKLLYKEWNPIGIDNLPEDEYESYVPAIFNLTINGSNKEEIANKLLYINSKQMELSGNRQLCLIISEKIIRKKESLGM